MSEAFPALWRYKGLMPQYWRSPDGTLHRLTAATIEPQPAPPDALAGDHRVVLVDIVPRRYLDLRPLLAGGRAGDAIEAVPPPPGFVAVARRTLPGLYWTTLTIFERSAPPAS